MAEVHSRAARAAARRPRRGCLLVAVECASAPPSPRPRPRVRVARPAGRRRRRRRGARVHAQRDPRAPRPRRPRGAQARHLREAARHERRGCGAPRGPRRGSSAWSARCPSSTATTRWCARRGSVSLAANSAGCCSSSRARTCRTGCSSDADDDWRVDTASRWSPRVRSPTSARTWCDLIGVRERRPHRAHLGRHPHRVQRARRAQRHHHGGHRRDRQCETASGAIGTLLVSRSWPRAARTSSRSSLSGADSASRSTRSRPS